MAFTKITQADVNNKGVIGLPDTPGMTTTEIQQKFDQLALEVLMPKHNALIDELEAGEAGASIGVKDADNEDTTLQARLDDIAAGIEDVSLEALTDTDITNPTEGQALIYDATSEKWINGEGGGGGATDLDDLTDVTITSATNGQVLTYDSTDSKWKNTTTEKHLTATISSGTTLSFTDSSILSTSILDLYVDSNTPVPYDSVTVTSGSGATFTLSEAVTSSTTFLLIVR